jgi:hypothetical protein
MDSSQLLDLFRSEMSDVDLPTLWSDDEIFNYIDDAQKMFCRLAHGINDAMSKVTQISVLTTTDTAATSPTILKIRQAYQVSDGQPIEIINYEDLGRLGVRLDGRTGPVKMLITGMSQDMVKLYPAPNVANTIQLLVERLPLKGITGSGQLLEINDRHHPHLLLWVKHRAYLKQDSETRDDKKAADMKMAFKEYCELAFREKERAMHKTRVVVYGGIPMSAGQPSYDRKGRSNGSTY